MSRNHPIIDYFLRGAGNVTTVGGTLHCAPGFLAADRVRKPPENGDRRVGAPGPRTTRSDALVSSGFVASRGFVQKSRAVLAVW
jgi:hypothetical protein